VADQEAGGLQNPHQETGDQPAKALDPAERPTLDSPQDPEHADQEADVAQDQERATREERDA
jgi:hypothetical protein